MFVNLMFGMEYWFKGIEINRIKVNLKIVFLFLVKLKINWVMIGYDYLWIVSFYFSMLVVGWIIVWGLYILF